VIASNSSRLPRPALRESSRPLTPSEPHVVKGTRSLLGMRVNRTLIVDLPNRRGK
jgi:hypothetical protein